MNQNIAYKTTTYRAVPSSSSALPPTIGSNDFKLPPPTQSIIQEGGAFDMTTQNFGLKNTFETQNFNINEEFTEAQGQTGGGVIRTDPIITKRLVPMKVTKVVPEEHEILVPKKVVKYVKKTQEVLVPVVQRTEKIVQVPKQVEEIEVPDQIDIPNQFEPVEENTYTPVEPQPQPIIKTENTQFNAPALSEAEIQQILKNINVTPSPPVQTPVPAQAPIPVPTPPPVQLPPQLPVQTPQPAPVTFNTQVGPSPLSDAEIQKILNEANLQTNIQTVTSVPVQNITTFQNTLPTPSPVQLPPQLPVQTPLPAPVTFNTQVGPSPLSDAEIQKILNEANLQTNIQTVTSVPVQNITTFQNTLPTPMPTTQITTQTIPNIPPPQFQTTITNLPPVTQNITTIQATPTPTFNTAPSLSIHPELVTNIPQVTTTYQVQPLPPKIYPPPKAPAVSVTPPPVTTTAIKIPPPIPPKPVTLTSVVRPAATTVSTIPTVRIPPPVTAAAPIRTIMNPPLRRYSVSSVAPSIIPRVQAPLRTVGLTTPLRYSVASIPVKTVPTIPPPVRPLVTSIASPLVPRPVVPLTTVPTASFASSVVRPLAAPAARVLPAYGVGSVRPYGIASVRPYSVGSVRPYSVSSVRPLAVPTVQNVAVPRVQPLLPVQRAVVTTPYQTASVII